MNPVKIYEEINQIITSINQNLAKLKKDILSGKVVVNDYARFVIQTENKDLINAHLKGIDIIENCGKYIKKIKGYNISFKTSYRDFDSWDDQELGIITQKECLAFAVIIQNKHYKEN